MRGYVGSSEKNEHLKHYDDPSIELMCLMCLIDRENPFPRKNEDLFARSVHFCISSSGKREDFPEKIPFLLGIAQIPLRCNLGIFQLHASFKYGAGLVVFLANQNLTPLWLRSYNFSCAAG